MEGSVFSVKEKVCIILASIIHCRGTFSKNIRGAIAEFKK